MNGKTGSGQYMVKRHQSFDMDKMKFGIARFIGNVSRVSTFRIIAVNKQFCLNYAAVKVNLGSFSVSIKK